MSGRLVAARNQSPLRHVFETPKELNYEYHTYTQRQKWFAFNNISIFINHCILHALNQTCIVFKPYL